MGVAAAMYLTVHMKKQNQDSVFHVEIFIKAERIKAVF